MAKPYGYILIDRNNGNEAEFFSTLSGMAEKIINEIDWQYTDKSEIDAEDWDFYCYEIVNKEVKSINLRFTEKRTTRKLSLKDFDIEKIEVKSRSWA